MMGSEGVKVQEIRQAGHTDIQQQMYWLALGVNDLLFRRGTKTRLGVFKGTKAKEQRAPFSKNQVKEVKEVYKHKKEWLDHILVCAGGCF